MAKRKGKKFSNNRYAHIHKLLAAVSLIAFTVITLAGLMAEARVITIAYRACAVLLVIKLVSVVVIRVLSTYEEMNSGQA